MAYTPNVTLINGGFTDFEGSPLNLGYLVMQLSHDEQYTTGSNQVVAGLKLKILLDANGNIPASPATKVFANDAMLPSGSFYTVLAYKADGTQAWADEQFWTILSSPSTLDVGTIVPTNPPGGLIGSGGGSTLLLETNGTTNSNQSLLNIAQGTNVTITNVSGTTTINATGSSFSTAGEGYFFGAQSFAPIVDDTGHNLSSNNTVYAVQLFLESTWVVSHVSCMVITADGTGHFVCAALYNAAGSTKLIDAGTNAFDTSTTSQKCIQVNLGSPVTLAPGQYWFACGTTGINGGSVLSHESEIWLTQMVNGISNSGPQVGPTRYGTSSNAIVAGAMPASLGTITPLDHTGDVTLPAIMFSV
jgi:hypothetical protein